MKPIAGFRPIDVSENKDGWKWLIGRLERGDWMIVRDIPPLAVAFENEADARRAIETYLNR